ncbi:MAG: DUF6476 family protein [Pseudomonadota bacterium]
MDDQPPTPDEKALRTLRRLVTVLTAVMIIGIVTITVLLAIRLNQPVARAEPEPIPEDLALPDGAEVLFAQRRNGNIHVMTMDATVFVLTPDGTEVLSVMTPEMADLITRGAPRE